MKETQMKKWIIRCWKWILGTMGRNKFTKKLESEHNEKIINLLEEKKLWAFVSYFYARSRASTWNFQYCLVNLPLEFFKHAWELDMILKGWGDNSKLNLLSFFSCDHSIIQSIVKMEIKKVSIFQAFFKIFLNPSQRK